MNRSRLTTHGPAALLTLGLTLAGVVVAASGSARRADWTVPVQAVDRVNPLTATSDVIAGGAKLFHQRCEQCHGENAQGLERGPDLTARIVQRQSDGALFWKVTTGNAYRGMPSFSFLPEPQRWQLVLYLRGAAAPSRIK
jgi:mono/diheme cytochrome c family protein